MLTGKEIAAFSAFPGEMEVLIPPNTFFEVRSRIQGEVAKKAALPELAMYNLAALDVYQLHEI